MLARLKEPLDAYHQQRADKHGWLYVVTNHPVGGGPRPVKNLYEARSIATGMVCTFRPECMEVVEDGA